MTTKAKKLIMAAIGLVLVAAIAAGAIFLLNRGESSDEKKESKKTSASEIKKDDTADADSDNSSTPDKGDFTDGEVEDFDDFIDSDGSDDDFIGGTDIDDDFNGDYTNPEDTIPDDSNGSNDTDTEFDDDLGSDNGEGDDFNWDDNWDDDWDLNFQEYTNPIQMYGTAKQGTSRNVLIETENVIHEDFLGFGDHAFVAGLNTQLMESVGYNESFFEFDMTRNNIIDSNLVRTWFQIDWIVTDTEKNPTRKDYLNNKDYQNYKKGIYNFDSDAMKSVYRYVERYDEMGTDVMINFAWKHDQRIQTWFSVPSDKPVASAPYETEYFAQAAAATMKNFMDRGHNNVKYLTCYNEPANGGDFITVGESAPYAAILSSQIDQEMKKIGIREDVIYMGAENNDHWRGLHAWMDKFVAAEQEYDSLDYYSVHHYYKTPHGDNGYQVLYEDFLYFMNVYGKRMMITEMSASEEDCTDKNQQYFYHHDWNDTYSSYIIAAGNVGLKGVLCWGFGGGYTGGVSTGWQGQYVYEATIEGHEVKPADKEFFECGLICNYIDSDSDVLMVEWTGDDIRVAVFKNEDGDYTILMDTKGGDAPLNINFNFDANINKTFYRFMYDRDQTPTLNAEIPSCQNQFTVSDKFSDTVDAKEAMYIYTTKKPRKQVLLNEPVKEIGIGDSFDFDATLVDCDPTDEIVWSISSATNKQGTLTADGLYTASPEANIGDYVTVRAAVKGDTQAYATALIKIA